MRKQILSEATESSPREVTILGNGAFFQGKLLKVDGDLRIDGEVEVDELVVDDRLIVSPSGTVTASRIRSRDVIVAGNVRARFEVESTLVLKETGRASGVIFAARLIVEDGGVCDGTFNVGTGASAGSAKLKELPLPGGMTSARSEGE